LAVSGAVLALALIIAFGQLATRPTPSDVPKIAANEERVVMKTADGVGIAGSFFPVSDGAAPVILLLHGNGASRAQFKEHVVWLNAAGYSALAIDLRGHGESGGDQKSFGLFESRDADAALNWIRSERPYSGIGVIGVSLGGAAYMLRKDKVSITADALILQAVYPDIDRAIYNRIASRIGGPLATIGAPTLTLQSRILFGVPSGQISPITAAAGHSGPVLVIGGANDVYTPPDETKALRDAFPGESALWIAPGWGTISFRIPMILNIKGACSPFLPSNSNPISIL
jgi:uncharacterized protein